MRTYFPDVITHENNVLGVDLPRELDLSFLKQGLIDPYFDIFSRITFCISGPYSLLLADLLNKPREPIIPLAIAVELLIAGLVSIDDLNDLSLNRAGKPCSYRIHGIQTVMNVGELMITEMHRIILKMSIPEKTKNLLIGDSLKFLNELRIYQAIEFQMIQQKHFASVAQYVNVDGRKNSPVTALPASQVLRMYPVSKELEKAILDLSYEISIYLKLINDINSVENEEYYKTKGTGHPGEDFLNGKVNVIIAQTIQNLPGRAERVKEILMLETRDQDLVDELLSIVHESEAIPCIKEMIQNRVEEKWSALEKLIPDSDAKTDLFNLTNSLQNLNF